MKVNIKKNSLGILLKYHRKKKKVSQVLLAGKVGLDNSIISRIENSEIIPSIAVVNAIGDYLKLVQTDKDELNNAFVQAVLHREGVSNERVFLNDSETIHLAGEFLANTHTLRIQGMPKLAVAESIHKIDLLTVLGNRSIKASVRQQIYLQLSRLLMEVSKSYMDFLPPEDVWSYMRPLIESQKNIAFETNDPKSIMMAVMSEESAYYVSKNYTRAHEVGKELYKNLNFLDKSWHSEIIRASAINAGYLNSQVELQKIETDVTRFLKVEGYSDPMNSSFILEGLARAQSSINDSNTLKTIEKAWSYIDIGKKNGTYSALRTVQLIRTQLKAMIELGDTSHSDFEKLGTKGLILSEELGYTRYENEITALLNTVLNSEKHK